MPTSGSSSRIVSAARRPSSTLSGGMRTSMIATSGVCARTLRSRSSASPACATTSKPASSSRRAAPSRSRTASSGDHDAWDLHAQHRTAVCRTDHVNHTVECRHAVGQPSQPRARARPGTAAPVVANLHAQAVVHANHRDLHLRRRGVTRGVREALSHAEVGGLHRRGEARIRYGNQRRRHTRAGHERLQRRPQATLGKSRGVDPARELAQLLGRLRQVGERGVEQLLSAGGFVVQPGSRHAQVEGQLHEPLLRAVMEVTFQLASRFVRRLDDPHPRRLQLGLGGLAVGDVAEVSGERRWTGHVDPGDGQLHWKRGAVGAQPGDLEAMVKHHSVLRREVASKPAGDARAASAG